MNSQPGKFEITEESTVIKNATGNDLAACNWFGLYKDDFTFFRKLVYVMTWSYVVVFVTGNQKLYLTPKKERNQVD